MIVESRIMTKMTELPEKNDLKLEKDGNAPAIIAKVVNPNEKPGRPGNKLEMATKQTGIVRLKRNIPIIATTGTCDPKNNSSADSVNPLIVIFIQPK